MHVTACIDCWVTCCQNYISSSAMWCIVVWHKLTPGVRPPLQRRRSRPTRYTIWRFAPCSNHVPCYSLGSWEAGARGISVSFPPETFSFRTSRNKVLASVLSEPWFFSASYPSTMKMEADGSFETAVNFHYSSWCQMSADIVRDSQNRQNLIS